MCKILIVEDEKPISELIRINLTNAGHDCTCVYDGKAAADLLENTRFDLVLLDVMLPNVDGFELMDYIRPMDIPVIAYQGGEVLHRGLWLLYGRRCAGGRDGIGSDRRSCRCTAL